MNAKLRKQVYDKFGGVCAYTGTPLLSDWQVDHIIPQRRYKLGIVEGDVNDITNLLPCNKIINHYKRELDLVGFRYYMSYFHKRLAKLPKQPYSTRGIRRKEYMLTIAELFDITSVKPFAGKFYFEQCNTQ